MLYLSRETSSRVWLVSGGNATAPNVSKNYSLMSNRSKNNRTNSNAVSAILQINVKGHNVSGVIAVMNKGIEDFYCRKNKIMAVNINQIKIKYIHKVFIFCIHVHQYWATLKRSLFLKPFFFFFYFFLLSIFLNKGLVT